MIDSRRLWASIERRWPATDCRSVVTLKAYRVGRGAPTSAPGSLAQTTVPAGEDVGDDIAQLCCHCAITSTKLRRIDIGSTEGCAVVALLTRFDGYTQGVPSVVSNQSRLLPEHLVVYRGGVPKHE